MANKFGSPIQTQMAVAVFDGPCNGEYHGNLRTKPAGTRRAFVQTENGHVFGMELARTDNVCTVKKRLELVESSLTFGDLTLNNDLSAIRNDSAILLTRNATYRSSSTPCLSPTERNCRQRDQSGPIEVLGSLCSLARTNEIVKEIEKAIKNGVDPIPIGNGLGGAYCFRNSKGENVAIVKPIDEEPFAPNNPKGFVGKALGQSGVKHSVRVGETGYREVAAYLLDYDHFANVPPTVLVEIKHSIFNLNDGVIGNKLQKRKKISKIASLQQFIPHDFDAGDYGTSSFPVSAVHRIGILDVRIFNTDRHAGNILVRKLDGIGRFGQVELIPIDHGLCLPESLEDPYFEWIHWPQASIPFSEDELDYIKNLDPLHDSEVLRTELPMIRAACLRALVLCSIFLQEAAAFGLCLAEIGEMMSREFRSDEEEPSELEVVCLQARKIIGAEREMSFFDDADGGEEEFLFDIDCEDPQLDSALRVTTRGISIKGSYNYNNGIKMVTGQKLPSKPESLEENQVVVDEKPTGAHWDWLQTASKISQSVKEVHFHDGGHGGTMSDTRRSANEQLLATTTSSFVKLADMGEEEWISFLDKFKELLPPALAKRRNATIGRKQRHRLGTSCKF